MSESTTDPIAEVTAMKTIAEALSKLDADATARVLRWAVERFAVRLDGALKRSATEDRNRNGALEDPESPASSERGKFNDLAELYAAASPQTEADRALVTGYWFQYVDGESEFAAQTLNSALKNLGHGVGNITQALDTLKAQRPALVMQIKKSGTTKQARKTYKLTAAAKKAVEAMIGHE